MRWLITLLLLLLVLAGGVWLVAGDRVRTTLGLAAPTATLPASFTQLDHDLKPTHIRQVVISVPGYSPLTLTRATDGAWSQPGNWPVRETEAELLVNTLTGLRSRFAVVPVEANLAEFGLEKPDSRVEVTVDVVADGATKTVKLLFARPNAAPGESEFVRPCYLRIDTNPEVVRLGPDVYPVLARSPEVYRRRQLFPDVERVKLSGDTPASAVGGRLPLFGDAYQSIRIVRPINYALPRTLPGEEGQGSAKGQPANVGALALKLPPDPDESAPESKLPPFGMEPPASAKSKPPAPDAPSYTLRRDSATPTPRRDPDRPTSEPAISTDQLAAAWSVQLELPNPSAPVRDRPDPAKLRAVLTALPDLWVESFSPPSGSNGLDNPERSLTVTRTDGKAITIQIGHVSHRTTKTEPAPPPMFPGAPPMPPRETVEEFRYAKLKDNDLVFELRTDPLNDLFTDPQELRDAALVRFETAEVNEFTVAMQDRPPMKFTRRKGNKLAEKDEEKQDRWYVGEVLAQTEKVTEFLDAIRKLDAKGEERLLDNVPPAKLKELALDPGESKITIVTQTKVAEGDPAPAPRTATLILGKHDKQKLNVQVAGWSRVNVVDDTLVKLLDRPAIVYRSRSLFDTAEMKLDKVTVTRRGGSWLASVIGAAEVAGSTFAIEQSATGWNLTRPVRAEADGPNATQFANTLSRLEVTEYTDASLIPAAESPRRALAGGALAWASEDATLQRYGLAEPRIGVQLGFTGGKPSMLAVGRAASPEAVYAWLPDERIVFTIPKTAIEPLEKGAVALLPLQLWASAPDRVTEIAITRGGASYKVSRSGPTWNLSGPFAAPAGADEVQSLVAIAANMRAERYDALAVDPAKHGLGTPALRVAVTYRETNSDATMTKTLLVGKDAGPGQRYAKLDGDAVFVIPDVLLAVADRPAVGWLDKKLLAVERSDVAKIQIAGPTPDSHVTLTRVTPVTWKAEGAAFKIDQPTLDALLLAASRPPIVALKDYGPAVKWADFGLDKPEYTITLTVAGDKPATHTLKLGKKDASGERPVRIDDGPAVGVLLPRTAETLARGKLDFIDRTLLDFPKAALATVSRKMGGAEFELVRGALIWDITKPAKQKADKQSAEELADMLASLRSVRVAAVAPPDLDKPFGLKTPAATLTLSVGTDKVETKVLHVGAPVDAAKPDGERYVSVAGSDAVGVLPGLIAKKLLGEPLKFREWTQPRFVDVDRLTLERGDRKVTFAKVGGTWKVTEPLTTDAEHSELEDFIDTLGKLRADELVADKPTDLKPFGLDKPEAKWKLFDGDREVLSLHVGGKEKDSRRVHAKLEKGDLVALLTPEVSARLLREYRKRAVWPEFDAMTIDSVVISSGTATFSLTRTPTGWIDPMKPTDPVDPDKVAETLSVLAALRAERFVADKDAKLAAFGLEKPKWVIVVTPRGGPARTLQLGDATAKQAFAKLPDQTAVFTLSEADTAKLTRDRGAYGSKR